MKKLPTEIGKSRHKGMEGSCRIIMFLAAGAAFAQPQDSRPAYVVASVKPNASFSDSSSSHGSTGQVVFTNLSLKRYIERAFNVKPFQVIGPDWMESVHFDITAKYPPDTKDADRPVDAAHAAGRPLQAGGASRRRKTGSPCAVARISLTITLMHAIDRRVFCRTLAAGAAGLRLGRSATATPNIVYVLADDLGWGDLRCYNPKSAVPTPNADRLATQGGALHRHALSVGGMHADPLRHSDRPLLLAKPSEAGRAKRI